MENIKGIELYMQYINMDVVLNLVLSLVILIVGKIFAKWLSSLIIKQMEKSSRIDDTLTGFLSSVVYGFMIVLVVLTALSQAGVETTSFIAILGAAGLAIALAFKDSLSNISSGIMIIIFRPIKVGEFVELAGAAGTVDVINLFNTILKTTDNKVIIIANANVIGSNIINYSRKETRRVDIKFGISYDDDLKKAKTILETIIKNDERILNDPEPLVAVSELGDSSVNFITRSWVKSADYWPVYFSLVENVKLEFDKNDITIPYPQMDIHTKS